MEEDDNERHKRQQQELRVKRKASKMSKSEAQLEKERKQKEYRQKVLKQHAGSTASSSGVRPGATPSKTTELTKSVFQELFSQRAQGFQIDFRFRNAPPRPPVGPTFVGNSLDSVLLDLCQQYRPLNAVEVQYKWKLHSEPDLGVPLAPSAMDLRSYSITERESDHPLHKDDAELLNWTGHLGDTAADELKAQQERKRMKDRLILSGNKAMSRTRAQSTTPNQRAATKGFSRVLNEGMQTWMKKTTYLSNDYTRKVHDFKSLAQTKQELAQDLQLKQEEMTKRRSATSISQSFADIDVASLKHPLRKQLRPKAVFPLLPNVELWGLSLTHVVMDKAPLVKPPHELATLNQAFVGNVERLPSKARMACQLFFPSQVEEVSETPSTAEGIRHEAVQSYDLDVVPLKDEDVPHSNFVITIDRTQKVARYLPISARVQLSRGRPIRAPGGFCHISRRPVTEEEQLELEERAAEVNLELAEKHGIIPGADRSLRKSVRTSPSAEQDNERDDTGFMGSKSTAASERDAEADDDDDEDFGDDDDSSDSGDEALFGTSSKTIVAEG